MVKLIADLATKSNEIEIEPLRSGARWFICDIARRYKTLAEESYSKTVLSAKNCY